jgi:nucleotide-binding universal stress UspA family protein
MKFNEFKVNRIAVPTDFSQAANVAIDHAADLAKRFGAEIILIHILDASAYGGIFVTTQKSEYKDMELAQLKLQEESEKLRKRTGLQVLHFVSSGRVYDEIVRIANEEHADLIVMGTHGVSGWAEFFAGSNAFKVVTQSDCPVLSIQENATKTELKNIILPIDQTDETRQKVRYAVAFAKKFDATIHIASLLTDDEPAVRYDFEKKVKQIADYFDREGVRHTQTTLVGSNLATMTMNFGESKGGNLIVMMTEQEANLTGFLMGPYAQQLVNHSRIPVLSISPEEGEGFSLT